MKIEQTFQIHQIIRGIKDLVKLILALHPALPLRMIVGEIFKTGVSIDEGHRDISDRSISLFSDDDLRQPSAAADTLSLPRTFTGSYTSSR